MAEVATAAPYKFITQEMNKQLLLRSLCSLPPQFIGSSAPRFTNCTVGLMYLELVTGGGGRKQ